MQTDLQQIQDAISGVEENAQTLSEQGAPFKLTVSINVQNSKALTLKSRTQLFAPKDFNGSKSTLDVLRQFGLDVFSKIKSMSFFTASVSVVFDGEQFLASPMDLEESIRL